MRVIEKGEVIEEVLLNGKVWKKKRLEMWKKEGRLKGVEKGENEKEQEKRKEEKKKKRRRKEKKRKGRKTKKR